MNLFVCFIIMLASFGAGSLFGAVIYEDGMLSVKREAFPVKCEVRLYPKTTNEVHVYSGEVK